MKRTLLLCTILCSTVINCSRFDEAPPPGSGGAGGAGVGGGAGGVGGGGGRGLGGMMTHPELCGIVVTCQDGVLSGMYGDPCYTFSGVCPLGCRVSSAGTGDRSLDPFQFAQTLCVSPDAGDAGSDAGANDAGEDAARPPVPADAGQD